MTTLAVYAILGLLVALPISFLGSWIAGVQGHLVWIDETRLKRLRIGKEYEGYEVALIPFVISGVLLEGSILYLANAGTLRLSILGIVLGVIGLAIGGGVVGFIVTFVFLKLFVVFSADTRGHFQNLQRSTQAVRRRMALEELKQGTPGTKVHRCGICGVTSSTGRYAATQRGMVLCAKHTHLASGTEYECPSCGYKFDPKNNRDYFEEHRCSNCGRSLDDSSWG